MGNPIVQLMMPMSSRWAVPELAMVFVMWSVMMGAMMLPSAMPMILSHRRMCPQIRRGRHVAFVAAYLLIWSGFSGVAALLQWWLQKQGLLSRMLVLTDGAIAGAILIGIGVFQFTQLKDACLRTCRTPLGFLMTEWRDGTAGAFAMGLKHGAYCVGCCWALMATLFVFGVMNVMAVALLTTAVALEKLTPWGVRVARLIGAGCLLLGAGLLIADWPFRLW